MGAALPIQLRKAGFDLHLKWIEYAKGVRADYSQRDWKREFLLSSSLLSLWRTLLVALLFRAPPVSVEVVLNSNRGAASLKWQPARARLIRPYPLGMKVRDHGRVAGPCLTRFAAVSNLGKSHIVSYRTALFELECTYRTANVQKQRHLAQHHVSR